MTWTIVDETIVRRNGKPFVLAVCGCGAQQYCRRDHIKNGRSGGCSNCGHPKGARTRGYLVSNDARIRGLQKLASSVKSRCCSPTSGNYKYYGGRGIEFRFESTKDFVEYILRVYPLDSYKGWEIDRTDNNGHYERGNIRLATRSVQNRNRRTKAEMAGGVPLLS